MTASRSPGARFVRRLPTGSSGAASGHRFRSFVWFCGRYLSVLESRQADVLPSAHFPTQTMGQIPKRRGGDPGLLADRKAQSQ